MTENQHLISIIMPVRDTENYVGETLDSIVNQSFQNWELIAVNDNSSDNSLGVMLPYTSDKRIKIVSNPNPGLLNALRYGYSKASGTIIHRMDSDDLMPKNKLERMMEAWKIHGKGCVITGGVEYFIDQGELGDGFIRYAKWLTDVSAQNTHAENIYRESVIASNCWLVHREDFDRIGGFNPNTFPEDYDLCFRFYCGGIKIVGLDAILHKWRDRPDRISRNWAVYKDNRFFALKVNYFYIKDRERERPLVLWGGGKNGKDLAQLLLKKEANFHWVCDNQNKIGKEIYGMRMHHYDSINSLHNPQIIIAVAGPNDQMTIAASLKNKDYWFFQ